MLIKICALPHLRYRARRLIGRSSVVFLCHPRLAESTINSPVGNFQYCCLWLKSPDKACSVRWNRRQISLTIRGQIWYCLDGFQVRAPLVLNLTFKLKRVLRFPFYAVILCLLSSYAW